MSEGNDHADSEFTENVNFKRRPFLRSGMTPDPSASTSARSSSGDVPIPTGTVATVADRRGIDPAGLGETLAAIHAALVDGADAILGHYRSTDGPEALSGADGLAEAVFVAPEQWAQLPTDLDERERAAAKAVHAAHARDLGASEADLEEYDPLVTPSQAVGTLVRAGLSRRQAEVQVLRDGGLTQAEIGDRLGLATNTVKVHCHRIDTKVENARRLLDVVGS